METKKDFIEFIALLNSEKVRYLILGGYAVSYHVRPRATGDIDFFYSPDDANCAALERALVEFAGSSNITAESLRQHGSITMIGLPPTRIDLLNSVSGLEFDMAWERRVAGTFGPEPAWYVSKLDLLANKTAAGRSKDVLDIEWLESETQ